ncbi:MAG: cysteine hydrolase [Lachnospiraceae bacterium]|nr:cysteine hydrolase [Candidatus Equihabitans merdae]
MKVLIVVDMQTDFVDGALGTAEAVAIVPNVKARIEKANAEGVKVIFTRDTHFENYMETQEGRNLPVPHCIKGTDGWQIVPELTALTEGCQIIDKPTFGSVVLGQMLCDLNAEEAIEEITLIGLCTDICVISNAMIAKANLTEVPVAVEEACCAGVTPATHTQALEAMKMCQIAVR